MMTEQIARAIADATGTSRFERYGYDAKSAAQRNLSGRTHYADDDALRFFHARIQSARPECHGSILVIVESVAADMRNTSRGFRFVAFDLFGTIINDRPGVESLHKKSDQARQAAVDWLESFDVLEHYRAAMTERAERLERQAAKLTECVKSLGADA
jgi:hypothetical protein